MILNTRKKWVGTSEKGFQIEKQPSGEFKVIYFKKRRGIWKKHNQFMLPPEVINVIKGIEVKKQNGVSVQRRTK